MKKNCISFLVLSFFAIIASNSFINAQKEAQPQYVMDYLKKHEVDDSLKKELNKLFSNYWSYISNIFTGEDDWEARDHLIDHGFSFAKNKTNVFTHKNFPGHIFKIGKGNNSCSDESFNLDRPRMAEIIRDFAKKEVLQ